VGGKIVDEAGKTVGCIVDGEPLFQIPTPKEYQIEYSSDWKSPA